MENKPKRQLTYLQKVEQSIVKTYRKDLWSKFTKGLKDFNLINDGDKIAVCISGGKDSFVLAKLMQQLKRIGKTNFELVFLSMDPGFHADNLNALKNNCKKLGIPVEIHNSDIFAVADMMSMEGSPCYLCARMRRGFLYSKAQELGCNKIALGHHYDDVIETTLLNVLYSGNFKTMVPKIKADNFDNMELIRPMVYIREKDIIRFRNAAEIECMDCGCIIQCNRIGSKRFEIKELIANLKKNFDNVDQSIFMAASNVNIDAVLGYQQGGKKFDFEDVYMNNLSKKNK